MAIIYSYPIGAPKSIDLLLGTSTFDENIDGSVPGNPTVSFTVQSLLSMIATSTGAQTLQQVTNIGATTTNPVIFTSTVQTGALSSTIVTSNGFINNGTYKDGGGSVGTAGQRLSSTGTITEWVTDTGQGVTDVTGISPIISSGGTTPAISLAVSGVTAAAYTNANITVDSFGRITTAADGTVADPTLSSNLSGQIELTASGGVTGGLGRTTLTGSTGVTITSSAGNNIVFTSTEGIVTSLTTTGTTGVSTLVAGVLNVPDYTYTEIDTLQSVTARGNTTNKSILMNGSGADGYLYVTGNAATGAPVHAQGLAFAYNNSGGSRENEIFWNTGTTDVATNNASYLGFWNEFLNSGAGNARVSDLQVKLYGTGALELTGPTATSTISNTFWKMPTTAAPNTGYYLSKAAATIDLEWTAPIWTQQNNTISAVQLSALNGSPITLLGTPGVDKAYFVNQAFFWFEAGGVVYDFPGFIEIINLGIGSKSITAGDLNSASSSMVATTLNSMRDVANLPVTLSNPNANPTQGDGVLYISISYQVKTLGPTIQAG